MLFLWTLLALFSAAMFATLFFEVQNDIRSGKYQAHNGLQKALRDDPKFIKVFLIASWGVLQIILGMLLM